MSVRLDKVVADRFGLSRRSAQEAVLNGKIDLDGARCDEPGRMIDLNHDQKIEFFPNRPKARRVQSQLRVLHEDRYLIIVDKPPGLLTLPTEAHESDTLINRVRQYLQLRHGGRVYAGIIHRLDKETSGAIVFAKTPDIAASMQNLLRTHDIERKYLAVVEGFVSQNNGVIDKPLAVENGDLRRRIAQDDDPGRRAVTRFGTLEHFGKIASLVACWLETGRTHQIRIHMADFGHPVVGDPVYKAFRPSTKARFVRQALHAQTLGFIHPILNQVVRVEAPLPNDLAALIIDLRNRYGLPNSGR